jgi:predicted O-methyltransferase YrrM
MPDSDTSPLDIILGRLNDLEQRQNEILLEQRLLYRQVEVLLSLYQQIPFRASFTDLRGWAASPDLTAILAAQIRQSKPLTIFEAGGGQSTVISAYCLEQLGQGHVYAVDHDAVFADKTRENIARHGLSDVATVTHAPLKDYTIKGETWQWYDLDCGIPESIDLLLIDGPPQYGQVGPMMRYPALPLLASRLSAETVIIMDDADREAETRIAELWMQEFPLELVRHYTREHGEAEKGAKIFRFTQQP